MRFFGYYALHSFINQLRKLFKTWVLIFLVVCMLIGGLIGFGAAMLEDTIESNQEPEAVTEVVEEEAEEDGFQLPIETTALIELIAGGAVLALFFFEAVSADKNGSKIFLPADVNLLFPSPMKPQSVLMFRLATQLGTALIATIYIMFQLPNLILNLGLSGWTALSIILCWFSSILIGKLLQVLLYTVCSTHLQFKKYLSRGVYAFGIILGACFFAFYKTSGLEVLPAADRFFNAPFTRWIPFWGWLKALSVYVSDQNWGSALLTLALLIVGSGALVYAIWSINADFYEDAMAKSEETAALMERARSEKTSGTAVTKQRKKDRSDSLRRDGLNRGWGASVFFHKTMYNRFRFAHLGFLTKTMETYFVAALGTAFAADYFFGYRGELPVVLTLGALVFFRAMGNPLAEDTGMDFFRLIPESTWQKLFFSLLGGTVSCLLDLILPMLAASALLRVNPLRLLMWLPLIVSVDFYATSVVTFIDLSVPPSIGKTIKSIITVMFIYFGLLPDIGLLAFGIALGYTKAAAIGSTVVNLALGVAAFSLASVFLQPKGRDVINAVADQDLGQAKKHFSRIGFAIFALLLITTVLQIVFINAAQAWFPQMMESSWATWILLFLPQYAIAMPVCMLILKKVPVHAPEKNKFGIASGVKVGFICVLMMYAGNLIGTLVTTLLGLLQGSAIMNPIQALATGENLFAQILVMVILAPVLEELIFRKALVDRMAIYGGKTSIILSAMLFALYHGNFSQFFYAFGLGLVFGYLYLNTGKIRNSIIAHMCINFMGSVFAPELLSRASAEGAAPVWNILFVGYAILLIVASIVGLVLLCMNFRNLHYPAGKLELPKGKRFSVSCLNTGMVLAILGCVIMMVLSVIGI